MEVEFNLQRFLSEMREEQQRGFDSITRRMDVVASDLVAHEQQDIRSVAELDKRLAPLESLRKDVRWMVTGCLSAAGITAFSFLVDLIRNHWSK